MAFYHDGSNTDDNELAVDEFLATEGQSPGWYYWSGNECIGPYETEESAQDSEPL